jgi:5-formyltetrahydrofolate cyclo-ligase
MSLAKSTIRRELLAVRDNLGLESRREKSVLIAARLKEQQEYQAAGTVLFYVSFRSEVATLGMITSALKEGKRVFVPKVDRKAHRLKIYEISDPARDLESGYMGIYEPVEGFTHAVDPAEADLVVLPGVGYDVAGRRLGYGGGYYDRLLETLKGGTGLIGLAFDAQVVEEIPSEEHDRKVSKIITETRVISA